MNVRAKKPKAAAIETVHDHIAWSHANLARAHAAITDGCSTYQRHHHIIRSRLFSGLKTGTMSMRSLYDDERLKLTLPQACCYCGSSERLSLDHLIPRIRGGSDVSDNLVSACRSCNSSKGGSDMLVWMDKKQTFPSLLLLRRYLKLVTRYCDENALLSCDLAEALKQDHPFSLALVPHDFPELPRLQLWMPAVAPTE